MIHVTEPYEADIVFVKAHIAETFFCIKNRFGTVPPKAMTIGQRDAFIRRIRLVDAKPKVFGIK